MKLTEKQENFAIKYVLNGGNATDAYQESYDTNTENMAVVYVNAHKVLKNDKVAIRIHELQMSKYSKHILSIKERKEILSTLSKNGDIKSIDLLNKMEGVYEASDSLPADTKHTLIFETLPKK